MSHIIGRLLSELNKHLGPSTAKAQINDSGNYALVMRNEEEDITYEYSEFQFQEFLKDKIRSARIEKFQGDEKVLSDLFKLITGLVDVGQGMTTGPTMTHIRALEEREILTDFESKALRDLLESYTNRKTTR